MPWQEDASWKVMGSNPSEGTIIFLLNLHLIELAQSSHRQICTFISMSGTMYCLACKDDRCTQNSNERGF